jgi:hypothetical protein
MKTAMRMSDLKKEDGFPANIDRRQLAVVQIPDKGQGIVLHTCKITGKQTWSGLPVELNKKYESKIYIIHPNF